MAKTYDRVLETTSTTGTGAYALDGATLGYRSFASIVANGEQVYYAVHLAGDWEVGIGTFTLAGTTLSRDTILSSSNGGSPVSWPAGTKNVWVNAPAQLLSNFQTVPTNNTWPLWDGADGLLKDSGLSFDSGNYRIVMDTDLVREFYATVDGFGFGQSITFRTQDGAGGFPAGGFAVTTGGAVNNNSGIISFTTGNVTGTSSAGGFAVVAGHAQNAAGGSGGHISFDAGNTLNPAISGGSIFIRAGDNDTWPGPATAGGGNVNIVGGGGINTGWVKISSGDSFDFGTIGSVEISTGWTEPGGTHGEILLEIAWNQRARITNTFLGITDGTNEAQLLTPTGLTATRTYAFPDQSGTFALTSALNTDGIALVNESTAAYSTLTHWLTLANSVGVSSGCTVTNGGAGTANISAGVIFVRTTDSALGTLTLIDFAGTSGLALTNFQNNWIYISYNGGSPVAGVETSYNPAYNKVYVALVARRNSVLHISPLDTETGNHKRNDTHRNVLVEGVKREEGGIVSETGTRNIAISAAKLWFALERYSLSAKDTSVADTFTYFYRDGLGDWTEIAASTQINNTQYDDGSGTLASLSTNRYGVHWVYIAVDGDIYVQFGQGNYTLIQAEAADIPPPPGHINMYHALLVAKIIIRQGESTFTSVQNANGHVFSGAGAANHGDLTGLGDDDHTQYALLAGRAGGQTLAGGTAAAETINFKATTHASSHGTLNFYTHNTYLMATLNSSTFTVTGNIAAAPPAFSQAQLVAQGSLAHATVRARADASGDYNAQFQAWGPTQQYTFGVDNSETGDPFVFSRSTVLGTNNIYTIDSTGLFTIGGSVSANRIATIDTSGRVTLKYNDNSLQRVLKLQNLGIGGVSQGVRIAAYISSDGTEIESGVLDWYSENATHTGATADSTMRFQNALNGALQTVLDIDSTKLAQFYGAVTIRNGSVFKINDSTNADSVAISHDGTDFNIAGTNTAAIVLSGITQLTVPGDVAMLADTATDEYIYRTFTTSHAAGNVPSSLYVGLNDGSFTGMRVVNVRDGSFNSQSLDFHTHHGGVTTGVRMSIDKDGAVSIFDAGGTDYATFSHNGTDFFATFVNTGQWDIGTHIFLSNGGTASELRLMEPSAGGSSYTGFKAPALAGNVIYTLPTADGTSGQALTTNGAGVLSWTTISGGGGLTLGTMVAAATGSPTQIDFTGIPAGVKEVRITFDAVSLSGTEAIHFQIGDSGGIEATGYVGSGTYTGATSGGTSSTVAFVLYTGTASNQMSGTLTLTLMDAATNLWAASGVFSLNGGNYTFQTAGSKALSATLDRVRIKSASTNTFDNGNINIAYA